MTRKRFVKLLMSRGYSRNEANHIADTGKKGQPYAELYFVVSLQQELPDFMEAIRKTEERVSMEISVAVRSALDVIARAAQAISEAVPGMVENMRRLQEAAEGPPSE